VSDPHPFHEYPDPGFEIFAYPDPVFEMFKDSGPGLDFFLQKILIFK